MTQTISIGLLRAEDFARMSGAMNRGTLVLEAGRFLIALGDVEGAEGALGPLLAVAVLASRQPALQDGRLAVLMTDGRLVITEPQAPWDHADRLPTWGEWLASRPIVTTDLKAFAAAKLAEVGIGANESAAQAVVRKLQHRPTTSINGVPIRAVPASSVFLSGLSHLLDMWVANEAASNP